MMCMGGDGELPRWQMAAREAAQKERGGEGAPGGARSPRVINGEHTTEEVSDGDSRTV